MPTANPINNNCTRLNSFCSKATSVSVPALNVPISLLISSIVPLAFLIFLLFKANRKFKPNESGSKSSMKQSEFVPPLLPFYYTFIQWVCFLYSLSFIITAFLLSYPWAIKSCVPILMFLMGTFQYTALFFLFMENIREKKYRVISFSFGAFLSAIDLGVMIAMEFGAHVPIIYQTLCGHKINSLELGWNIVHSAFFFIIFLMNYCNWKKFAPKLSARPSIRMYCLVLSIGDIFYALSYLLLYFSLDIGLCFLSVSYFIFHTIYPPLLYYTFLRDSAYVYAAPVRPASEKTPLMGTIAKLPSSSEMTPKLGKLEENSSVGSYLVPTETLAVDLEDEYIIRWKSLSIGSQIGVGGYGEVFFAQYKGAPVAVKKLYLQGIEDKEMIEFKREIKILSSLDHPNVLKLLGVCVEVSNLAIVTSFMSRGSLQNLLKDQLIYIDWNLRIRIASDIARGMDYLHSFKPPIVHRDLKSANILVGENFEIKVSDFGIAKAIDYEKTMSVVGTISYSAPELLRGERYTEKVDIYSFAVLLWEILTRKIPFDGLLYFDIITRILTEKSRLEIPEDCPNEYSQLIKDSWDENPKKRPTFSQIVTRLSSFTKECESWSFTHISSV